MKIVVVALGTPIIFKGEKISAYHDPSLGCLIINDWEHEPPEKLGAFIKWDYWYFAPKEKIGVEDLDYQLLVLEGMRLGFFGKDGFQELLNQAGLEIKLS